MKERGEKNEIHQCVDGCEKGTLSSMGSAGGCKMKEKERQRGEMKKHEKRARDRVKWTRTSKGEKTARGTGRLAVRSHFVPQLSPRHGVTTAQFVHSACGTVWGGSNERSLLGRAPTDESRRASGDLHPLCVISLRY